MKEWMKEWMEAAEQIHQHRQDADGLWESGDWFSADTEMARADDKKLALVRTMQAAGASQEQINQVLGMGTPCPYPT